jgi:hypothetical protein
MTKLGCTSYCCCPDCKGYSVDDSPKTVAANKKEFGMTSPLDEKGNVIIPGQEIRIKVFNKNEVVYYFRKDGVCRIGQVVWNDIYSELLVRWDAPEPGGYISLQLLLDELKEQNRVLHKVGEAPTTLKELEDMMKGMFPGSKVVEDPESTEIVVTTNKYVTFMDPKGILHEKWWVEPKEEDCFLCKGLCNRDHD